jgi:DNA-binding Xre family transcriptional regulator
MNLSNEIIEQPISQAEMQSFLGIAKSTLIRLRKKGEVPFITVGAKIMYQPSKVMEALTTQKN